ncbi:MAG: nucleotide exchange factor GrpE [Candidatus Pacebacteria bacterium]|nr:nucleotide exchange factor GrpE [Candidatus Paceibacterota bacterium]
MTDKNQDIKKKLEACQKEKDEYLENWKRERASFINYRKEESERFKCHIEYLGKELTKDILLILDNFEIAEKNIPCELLGDENVKGLLQIKKQLIDFLKAQGIEEIEVKIGDKFDPNFHEAVEEIEAKEYNQGSIVEELKKGYKLNNKVIRATKVKISK